MSSASTTVSDAIRLAKLGNLSEAATLFRVIWDSDRTNQESFSNYIQCLYHAKQYIQIVDSLNELRIGLSFPLNIQILRLCLIAAFRCGDHETQYDLLVSLHHLRPADPEICLQLSALLLQKQQIEDAELIVSKALALHPLDPALLTNLAIIYSEKGDYPRAETCYKSVVEASPQQFLGHYNLAMFLILMGRHAEARKSLQKCLQIVPSAPEAIAALSKLEERDQRQGGLAEFYQSIEQQEWDRARKHLLDLRSKIDMFKYLAAASELRPADYEVLAISPCLCPSRVVYTSRIMQQDESLVNELIRCLKTNQTLVLNRAGKPTVGGFQTHEVLATCSDPSISELRKRILHHCDEYLKIQSHNPWLAQLNSGKSRDISGWGVILCDKGYQKRHVHPEGVLSGVVYLKTPAMTSSSASQEGNLIFSRFENYEVTPDVGKIVIFPSYLPHETVPIHGNEERICIAFNIAMQGCLSGGSLN
jgi:uncharacterized protein (TIGR02466 family)